jgi:nucleoporin NUP42
MDGAIDYVVKGAETHPNRLDMLQRAPEPARRGHWPFAKDRPNKPRYQPPNDPPASSSGFSGQPGMSNGATQSAFGQPAQNSFGGNGGFGAPQTQISGVFGQPSQPQQQASVFGQTLQSQAADAFGQPNQPQVGFSTPQMHSPFGQPQNNGMNGLGAQQSNFGQPQTIASSMPQDTQTGQVGLGQAPQAQSVGRAFGQPSPALNTGFGGQQQEQQQTSSFIQSQIHQAPALRNNGFGMQQQSGFGNNAQQVQTVPHQNGLMTGFTHTQASISTPVADISTYSTRDGSGRLLTWKGARVNYINNNPCYQAPDGSWERIWFPDGAPAAQSWNPAAQGYPQDMTTAYEHLRQNGTFQGETMPEMAPRHELIDWGV